eukprot:Nk52_evm38s1360 gene=Nk52_evmTU38s1360
MPGTTATSRGTNMIPKKNEEEQKRKSERKGGKSSGLLKTIVYTAAMLLSAMLTMATFAHTSLFTICFLMPFYGLGIRFLYDFVLRKIFDIFYAWCVGYFYNVGSMRTYEYGDELPVGGVDNEKSIMMSNHPTWIDVTCMNKWFWGKNLVGAVNWVAFAKFKLIPFVYAGWLKGDALIQCDWKKDIFIMGECFEYFRNSPLAKAFYLFPEGAVMRPSVKQKSDNYCIENNLPIFDNLLYPRMTGFLFFIKEVRKHNGPKFIYDFTLKHEGWGPSGPSFADTFVPSSTERSLHIHTRIFDIDTLPRTDEGLKEWLENCYKEKDELLSYFNANGTFPTAKGTPSTPKQVPFLTGKFMFDTSLWLMFVYVTIYLWSSSAALLWEQASSLLF